MTHQNKGLHKAIDLQKKKNKKGEVVATDYQLITEITLSKVQKDKSMGENTSGAEVNEDWAVADAAVDMNKLD